MPISTDEYFRGIKELKEILENLMSKLNEINLNILALHREDIFYLYSDGSFDDFPQYIKCNCHEHKRGEYTVGWSCPIHGQQF